LLGAYHRGRVRGPFPGSRSSFRRERHGMQKLPFLALVLSVALVGPAAHAAKPEDVFKGKIFITKKRLPSQFASAGAFISAVKKAKTDKVWPVEEKGNDHALWDLEYIAFFASPLNDTEVSVKFWETTAGSRRYVAGSEQYTRDKKTRVFAARIQVGKPEFETNKRYLMTLESRGRVIARTEFWLLGKGPNYSGKVEFSDEEASKR